MGTKNKLLKVLGTIFLILSVSILLLVACMASAGAGNDNEPDSEDALQNSGNQDEPAVNQETQDDSSEPVDDNQQDINDPVPTGPTYTVCIDPGHPSEVNDGLTVQHGVTENNINWIVGLELKDLLEADGVNVVLTKSEELQLVTNAERAEIANNANSNLMFRIHCDSGSETSTGITFYYPDRQGTWDGNTGPPEELIPLCEEAAMSIHASTADALVDVFQVKPLRTDNDTYVGGRQGGALRGSIMSRVPVVLVELCYLSNPDDVAFITNENSRATMVSALAAGIMEYLGTTEPSVSRTVDNTGPSVEEVFRAWVYDNEPYPTQTQPIVKLDGLQDLAGDAVAVLGICGANEASDDPEIIYYDLNGTQDNLSLRVESRYDPPVTGRSYVIFGLLDSDGGSDVILKEDYRAEVITDSEGTYINWIFGPE